MNKETYNTQRQLEIDIFQKTISEQGHVFFRDILNNKWFDEIRIDISEVCLGDSEKYNCKFFPFRWLYEEGEWEFINKYFEQVLQQTKKTKVLKNKLEVITKNDWFLATTAALEIKAYCCFARYGIFCDIDPRISASDKKKADCLIKIKNREIIVEITACTKSIVESNIRIGALSVERMSSQIVRKIKEKVTNQLVNTERPTILIISLPPKIGADKYSSKCAIDECLGEYSQLSAVIILDSYLFKSGKWFHNINAKFPLMDEEKEYLSKVIFQK